MSFVLHKMIHLGLPVGCSPQTLQPQKGAEQEQEKTKPCEVALGAHNGEYWTPNT